ncbi:ribonuclease P protein component [Candidatus Falkowbacteria bacterium]|nr:ribonuclease P protein component [Candidatus Falkowbacteria bacterium]
MLQRKHRLTKEKDFELVFKKGRSFFVKELGVKVLQNNLDHPRAGIVVSNKISKKATERNKIKRRLREALHLAIPNIKSNVDILVITRPTVINLNYQEIESRLTNCLSKLRLI